MARPANINDMAPGIVAGIRSIQCKCGWEAVFIEPEEDDLMVTAIFEHLVKVHEFNLPQMTVTTH